jgi:hypothetical protein
MVVYAQKIEEGFAMDDGAQLVVSILSVVISIVLLLAIVQLFSVAKSLRQIKDDLRSIKMNGIGQKEAVAASVEVDLEARRKHMAEVAANWPAYGDKKN